MAERAVGPRSARLDLASLETLIDLIPDAAVAVDDGGRIRSANQLAAELFGFRRDELVGASLVGKLLLSADERVSTCHVPGSNAS